MSRSLTDSLAEAFAYPQVDLAGTHTPRGGANPMTGYTPPLPLGTAPETVTIQQLESWIVRELNDHLAGDERGGPCPGCGPAVTLGAVIRGQAARFACQISGLTAPAAQVALTTHLTMLLADACRCAGLPLTYTYGPLAPEWGAGSSEGR